MPKNLKVSIIISVLFLCLLRCRPIWERYPGGFWNILFFLAITILFLWLIIQIGIEIFRLIKQRKNLNFISVAPLLVMIISLFDGMYNPLNVDLDSIYGQVNLRACYEGTQNQATIKFRDSGNFEIHATGVFFYDSFHTGKYERAGDSIYTYFDKQPSVLKGDTLLIQDENLYLVKQDSLEPTHFYLGYCKGLN